VGQADLILNNAKVFRYGQPLLEGAAVAVKSGKIDAVLSKDDAESFRGQHTEVIELGGRVLLPGFCDSHLHLAPFGRSLRCLDLAGAKSLPEALQRIRDALPRFENEPWILGRGWDQNLWGEAGSARGQENFDYGLQGPPGAQGKSAALPAGATGPSRGDLDSVVGEKPAALSSRCGHLVWCNSAALRAAGITSGTPEPPGGVIERDEHGEPTGILKEEAVRLIKDAAPQPDTASTKKDILAALREAHRLGVTSAVTMAAPVEVGALRELEKEGALALRVSAYVEYPGKAGLEQIRELGRSLCAGDWFSLCGLKLYADGSLGGQTAYMFEPYEGSQNRGVPVTCGEELKELVVLAGKENVPCAIHAIGDHAVADALSAIEESRDVNPDLRHRIEHAQLIRSTDLERFAKGLVIASMQPVHIFGDMDTAQRYWGKRCECAFVIKSLLETGARVALGTDCPIERLDPMLGLFAACVREPEGAGRPWHPSQRIGLAQALWCYSAEGAHAVGADNRRGTISAGMDADLIAVRPDFLNMELRQLLSTEVELTVIGGRTVHNQL